MVCFFVPLYICTLLKLSGELESFYIHIHLSIYLCKSSWFIRESYRECVDSALCGH